MLLYVCTCMYYMSTYAYLFDFCTSSFKNFFFLFWFGCLLPRCFACRRTTANFMTTSYSQQPIWREKVGFAQMFPVILIKVRFEGSKRVQMFPLGLSGLLESF